MKIIAIDEKRSSEHWIALETEPHFGDHFFKHFKRLAQSSGVLSGIKFECRESDLFVPSDKLTVGFKNELEKVLNLSEEAYREEIEANRKEAQLRDQPKQKAVKAAANLFGVDTR
jgi:hypothetical protein